ncbi:MAG: 23S rRNA (uracil(1939)-C(5))-methyltransferase RlmD [Clostridia bacterium]|nr:23S rRNA (uracil(1939)-C(5))-methyltransferase RlmD [Clostridia bacterium]
MSERITVRALGNEAQGIGTLANGKTIFVEGLLIGEDALVDVVTEKSRVATGAVVERLSSSPDRVEPFCPHYGKCGGCSCMHMTYDAQASFKENKVREVLYRVGRIEDEVIDSVFNKVVPSLKTTCYRNHVQYAIGGMAIGFRARDSHEIIEIDKCFLEYEAFGRLRKVLSDAFQNYPTEMFSTLILRGSERTNEYLVELVTETSVPHELVIRDAKKYIEATNLVDRFAEVLDGGKLMGVVLQICSDQSSKRYRTGKRVVLSGVDYYHEKLLDRVFRIKAGAFFQVNTEQAEKLYSIVKKHAEGSKVLYDLFCGTGSIGLCAVTDEQKLYGIEVSPEAVASAKVNAELSGVKNASFVVKQAERFDFESSKFDRADTIIVDPPRKGMDVALIARLLKMAPEKIIYVSCDPATLSRDLKMLCDKYEIKSVTPVDLFANTDHIETVCFLSQLSETQKM